MSERETLFYVISRHTHVPSDTERGVWGEYRVSLGNVLGALDVLIQKRQGRSLYIYIELNCILILFYFILFFQCSKLRVRPAPGAHISVDGRTFF